MELNELDPFITRRGVAAHGHLCLYQLLRED